MNQLISLDLTRSDVPASRDATVLAAFEQLPVGDSLAWTQTHDPLDLHQALMAQWVGQFAWTHQTHENGQWSLQLTRKPAGNSCCGSCGG